VHAGLLGNWFEPVECSHECAIRRCRLLFVAATVLMIVSVNFNGGEGETKRKVVGS
jgi:hypothetical protein